MSTTPRTPRRSQTVLSILGIGSRASVSNIDSVPSHSSLGRAESFSGKFQPLQLTDPIFGQHVADVIARPDHDGFSVRIPVVVRHCCHTLYRLTFRQKDSGLRSDGLFRISAQSDVLQDVKSIFDNIGYEKYCEEMQLFSVLDIYDSNVAAGTLKMYLRELEEPLMGFDSYRAVIGAVKSQKPAEQIARIIKTCIDRHLSVVDKIMLNVILFLLWETSNLSENMKAQNLGIVFGQIFFQAPIAFDGEEKEDVREQMQAIGYANTAVQIMIENYKKIFSGREKYLLKVYEPFYYERFPPADESEEIEVLNRLYEGETEKKESTEQPEKVDTETSDSGPTTDPIVEATDTQEDAPLRKEDSFVEEEIVSVVEDTMDCITEDFKALINKCNDLEYKKELSDLYERLVLNLQANK